MSFTTGSDSFLVSQTIPYIIVRRGSPQVMGSLNPVSMTTIELRKASNKLRGTTTAVSHPLFQTFEAYFANSNGDLVSPRVGNKVNSAFATDATLTIPAISIQADASTEQATGACMPSAPYSVYIRRGNYSDSETFYGTSGAAGLIGVNMSTWNVMINDRLLVTCRYPSGDRVRMGGFAVD
jgi:hypothetical protein